MLTLTAIEGACAGRIRVANGQLLEIIDEVMHEYAIPRKYLPEPFDSFQPTPIKADGTYGTGTSPAASGDKIVLRALMDVTVVASSCPQDQTPLNDVHSSGLRLVVRNA